MSTSGHDDLAGTAGPASTASTGSTGSTGSTVPRRSSGPASPFAGIPVADYLTDVLAAGLLLVSLALPWAGGADAMPSVAESVPGLLLTLVAVLSVSVHYLVRAGVMAGWNGKHAFLVRAVTAVAYLVAVVVYLVLDVVSLADATGAPAGIGTGAALGLAAAVLNGLPRRAELADVGGHLAAGTVALRGLLALGLLLALLHIAAIVLVLARSSQSVGADLATILGLLLSLVLTAGPVLALALRRGTWRAAVVAVGLVYLVTFLLVLPVKATTVVQAGGALVLLGAAAALAAHPALPWATGLAQARARGVAVASHAWTLSIVAAALVVVPALFVLFGVTRSWGSDAGSDRAALVARLLLALLVVIAALLARATLRRDAEGGWSTAVGATVVLAVLGLAGLVIVANVRRDALGTTEMLLALGLPLVAAYALAAPVRGRTFRSVLQLAGVAGDTGDTDQDAAGPSAEAPRAATPTRRSRAAVAGEPVAPSSGSQTRRAADTEVLAMAPVVDDEGDPEVPVDDVDDAPVIPVDGYATDDAAVAEDAALPDDGALAEDAAPVDDAAVADEPAPAGEPAPVSASVEREPAVETLAMSAPVAPVHGFTAAQAADPATPLEVLAQIAADAPELRPQLAANPSTYPDLLEWLAALDDPAVDAALASRTD